MHDSGQTAAVARALLCRPLLIAVRLHLKSRGGRRGATPKLAQSRSIGGWGVRSKWNGEPPYREIDFGFVFVRAVRAGEAKLRGRARESLLWLRRGRTKSISPGRPVPRGVPPVSRRCPAGVTSVSRRCPDDDVDDSLQFQCAGAVPESCDTIHATACAGYSHPTDLCHLSGRWREPHARA